jgi:hypothetical protein
MGIAKVGINGLVATGPAVSFENNLPLHLFYTDAGSLNRTDNEATSVLTLPLSA